MRRKGSFVSNSKFKAKTAKDQIIVWPDCTRGNLNKETFIKTKPIPKKDIKTVNHN